MNRPFRYLLLGILVASAFLAGRWADGGEEKPAAPTEAVRVLRYRIVWVDSALDLSHGGGRWVHELFFPDAKVTATLVFESFAASGETLALETRPRLYVGRSDKPRNDLTGLSDAPPHPVEEVEIPATLAKEILAFADLHDRHRAEGARLGTEFTSALGLKPLSDDDSQGSPPPVEPAVPAEE